MSDGGFLHSDQPDEPAEQDRFEIRRLQYRPDIPNCNEVAAFLGDIDNTCPLTEPHADEVWWIEADLIARCGDWIELHPNGSVTLVRP